MSKMIETEQFVSAVVVSAGNSTRMGGVNKQFLLLNDIPVIVHSVMAFQNNNLISEIVIVTKNDDISHVEELTKKFNLTKVKTVISGGNTRQESVIKGIFATSEKTDFVAIHDGARPLVTDDVITETVSAAFKHCAAAVGVKVKDTVKTIGNDSFITSTPNREYMRFVQTPQVFNKRIYIDAYSNVSNSNNFTDDCMLFEAYGKKVFMTTGNYENIKITTPEDISLAECYLKRRK